MVCRLKDFRRVSNVRNTSSFLAAVCIAATVSYCYESGPQHYFGRIISTET
jgi:hypothetical protein